MVERINHTFTANCVTDAPKDDVLAIALSVFANEYEISTASARRFGPVVSVRITFRTYDQENVIRLASLAASTLSHHWPTDTVRMNGNEPKYHGRHRCTEACDPGNCAVAHAEHFGYDQEA
jgi:hypothetical protein